MRLAHVLNTHFMYEKSQQKLMFDEELQSLSYSAYLKITLPKNQMLLRVHVSLTSFTSTFRVTWMLK